MYRIRICYWAVIFLAVSQLGSKKVHRDNELRSLWSVFQNGIMYFNIKIYEKKKLFLHFKVWNSTGKSRAFWSQYWIASLCLTTLKIFAQKAQQPQWHVFWSIQLACKIPSAQLTPNIVLNRINYGKRFLKLPQSLTVNETQKWPCCLIYIYWLLLRSSPLACMRLV